MCGPAHDLLRFGLMPETAWFKVSGTRAGLPSGARRQAMLSHGGGMKRSACATYAVLRGKSMRTGLAQQDARDDFDRARRRAKWARLAGWLRGRPPSRNRLPVLGELTTFPGSGPAGHSARRLQWQRAGRLGPASEAMVPINQIVGTVEPTRCFDRRFRPTSEHPRSRFERVAAEVRSGRGMDPVELYRCGDCYYVLDGHHRIAVARALGQHSVWASTTEVRLNQPPTPAGRQA
jgi:hypothetical protein